MFWGGVKGGHNFLSLFHVLDNFKNKIFEKKFGMTKIDRHFLLLYGVICFTLYTREIVRNRLYYFVACKCVIYFAVFRPPVRAYTKRPVCIEASKIILLPLRPYILTGMVSVGNGRVFFLRSSVSISLSRHVLPILKVLFVSTAAYRLR